MTEDRKQIELEIDACRPRSRDADPLQLDENGRDLLRRSQEFDQLVGELLRQGDVPLDLEARLAEQVSAAPQTEETRGLLSDTVMAVVAAEGPSGDAAAEVTLANQSGQDLEVPRKPRASRRLLAVSLGVVVLLALAVIWQGAEKAGSPLLASELADRAGRWLPRLEQQVRMPESWSAAMGQLPSDYETDPRLIPAARQWQAFSTGLDSRAVVLDVSSQRHGTAYLVVIKTSRRYSLPSYPLRKLTSTGEWSLAAWQYGDSLFVLVGGSDVQSLDHLVRSPDF
ncbi:MAG: hypothetical protein VB817_05975, partial [Pirellulaceae bacterium]